MKKPTKKTLNGIDMSKILEFIPKDDTNLQYINAPAGQEHYRLLTWIGGQVKGKIMELGTFRGHSVVCLGGAGNKVVTYDIADHISLNFKPDNIEFKLGAYGFENLTKEYSLLFIDTLHDGKYEADVLNELREKQWKGVVVMDDIILFPELAKLWDQIPERKADWTDIGHHSGTGIIWFE